MVKLVRLDLGGNLLQVENQLSININIIHHHHHHHHHQHHHHHYLLMAITIILKRNDQEVESGSLSSLPMLATLYLDGNRVSLMMVVMTMMVMTMVMVMMVMVMMVAMMVVLTKERLINDE